MYPHIPKKEIKDFLNKQIEENLIDRECFIHNNYVHKKAKLTLLEVIDWIRLNNPICGGHGVFYKNQHQVLNALAKMIISFLTSRKKFKAQLKIIKDVMSYIYRTFDRKQLSEKILANSIYGCLGNKASFLYNAYTAPSVTGTGQSLISTTCNAFEAFLGNNVAFNSIDECITFLNNIAEEVYEIDDSFLRNVTIDKVYKRLKDLFYKYKDEYDDIILGYLSECSQSLLNRIYYKNNIYEFSKHDKIMILLSKVIKHTDEFKDPNKIPESSKKYLDKLWVYFKQFVFYNNFYINRIQRLKNDERESVLTIDTDSNMINLNPWVYHMFFYIIDTVPENHNRDKDQLRFISINLMAFLTTNMITDVLQNYTATANVPEDYRHYINMKNEFLFSFMLLASKKKKYITSVRLREGSEIYPEKLDIKGFEFVKSSATEETKKYFENIIKKRLIGVNKISIPDILNDLTNLEEIVIDSLKNGEKKYLIPKSVKEEGAYKDGLALREQGFRAVCIWNILYPDNALELPVKTDIIKLTLDKDFELDRLKKEYPDIYRIIDEKILNNINLELASKKVPVIAIPRNMDIPDWVITFIDYDTITVDVLKKFYPVLESLGLELVKTTQKEYFSNIIDF